MGDISASLSSVCFILAEKDGKPQGFLAGDFNPTGFAGFSENLEKNGGTLKGPSVCPQFFLRSAPVARARSRMDFRDSRRKIPDPHPEIRNKR